MANPAETQQPTSPPPKEEGPRGFGVFLAKLAQGEAEITLSAEMFELTKRMQEEQQAAGGKVKGSLTLTINLATEGEDGPVIAGYDVKVKAPKPQRGKSYLWFTTGGNLSASPPKDTRQQQFPFRDVANAEGIPHDLNPDRGPAREV